MVLNVFAPLCHHLQYAAYFPVPSYSSSCFINLKHEIFHPCFVGVKWPCNLYGTIFHLAVRCLTSKVAAAWKPCVAMFQISTTLCSFHICTMVMSFIVVKILGFVSLILWFVSNLRKKIRFYATNPIYKWIFRFKCESYDSILLTFQTIPLWGEVATIEWLIFFW